MQRRLTHIAKGAIIILLFLFTELGYGQCKATFTGIPCVGNSLTFSTSATGFSTIIWDFNGEGNASQSSPAFVFSTAGTKRIFVITTFPNNTTCRDTLEIDVYPLPDISSTLITPISQCLTGNSFCFLDSSALKGCVSSIRYLFDDGELISRSNPTGVQTICKVIGGQVDTKVGYRIEVVSCNGCVRSFRSPDSLVVKAPRNVVFVSNFPEGCDTITGIFWNNTNIDLSDVERFIWNFGDGTLDSVNWGKNGISHFYNQRGPNNDAFDVTLSVWQKGGCVGTYKLEKAVYNTRSPKGIGLLDSLYCPNDLITLFVDGVYPPTMKFTWKVTGSPGNPQTFNEESPQFRATKLGPHRVVLTTSHPVCPDNEFYDTFVVIGPLVKIENILIGSLIPQEQRYQCRSIDTVYFPNNSNYYYNDKDKSNEDSSFMVNGVRYFVFDNSLYPVASQRQERKDDNIFRIWDFGDTYAPQCTTQTALGINVDKNCNFSTDRFPKHFYTPWDTVYKLIYYDSNFLFSYLDFNANGECQVRQVDTTEPDLHRFLFDSRIPMCIEVSLTEYDTSFNDFQCIGSDKVQLSIMETDMQNLMVEGEGCIRPGQTDVKLRASFRNTKPSCSYNTLYFNPNVRSDSTNWLEFVGLAPDNIYDFVGMFPPSLVYTYDTATIRINDDTLVVGFIVGNGVGANACFDTVFRVNPFHIQRAVSDFEIITPTNKPAKICIGDTLVFGKNYTDPLMALNAQSVSWTIHRYKNFPGTDTEVIGGVNEFRLYNMPHDHPDSSHAFMDKLEITNTLRKNQGEPVLVNTVVLSELFDYETTAELTPLVRGNLVNQWLQLGLPMAEFTVEKGIKMFWNGVGVFGDPSTGATGCIDTTGFTKDLKFKYNAKPNGRNSLNNRDLNIRPMSNITVNNILYENAYGFVPTQNGVYEVNLIVETEGGCAASKSLLFVVGFDSKINITDSIFCNNNLSDLEPSFRYYDLNSGGLDSFDYWKNREINAGKPGFEGVTKVDWHAGDDSLGLLAQFGPHPYGVIGYKKSYTIGGDDNGKIYYNDPGIYTLRITTTDSTGCEDTISRNLYILKADALFGLNIQELNCEAIIEYFDSSSLFKGLDSLFSSPLHELYSWEINWGDGKSILFKPNLPPQVGHKYNGFGTFDVQLIAKTRGVFLNKEPMCVDTFTYALHIPGPQPRFEPITSLNICLGDSVAFVNKSINPTNAAQFIWNLGDSTYITSNGNDTVVYSYSKVGQYEVYLLQSDSLPGTIHFCSAVYPDTAYMLPIIVNVFQDFDALLTQDKVIVCPGETVTFTTNFDSTICVPEWVVSGNGFDTVINSDGTGVLRFTFFKPGFYTIQNNPVFLDSNLLDANCVSNNTVSVIVDSIIANFEVDSSSFIARCFENTSLNSVQNYWGFYHETNIKESGEPFELSINENKKEFCINLPEKSGEFWTCLIAESPNGCLDTLCKLIRFNAEQFIYIPNIFTPGTDKFNDLFKIIISGHDLFELVIYNRWGDILFSSDSDSYQWNGNVNNGSVLCPDGTYIYKLKYRFEGKEMENTHGIITLIRER